MSGSDHRSPPEMHPLSSFNAADAGEALAGAFWEDGHPPSQWRRLITGDLALGRICGQTSRVALVNGRVAGAIMTRWLRPSAGEACVGHIGATGVRPQFAGAGLGRALVEAALEALAEAGCDWVSLEVAPENTRARRLYESLGFVARRELQSWRVPPAPASRARRAAVAEVLDARPQMPDVGPETRSAPLGPVPAFQRRRESLVTYAPELVGWGPPGGGVLRAGALQREGALFDLWGLDDDAVESALPPSASPLAVLHEPLDSMAGRWLARHPSAEPRECVLELCRSLAPAPPSA